MRHATLFCHKVDIATKLFTPGRRYSGQRIPGTPLVAVTDDQGHERYVEFTNGARWLLCGTPSAAYYAHFSDPTEVIL